MISTAQQTLDDAVAPYGDVKGRMARHGRDPDHLTVMPGAFPVVGGSAAEAAKEVRAARQKALATRTGKRALYASLGLDGKSTLKSAPAGLDEAV